MAHRRYLETHEWAELVSRDGCESLFVCGLSAFALKEFEEAVYLELPKPGSRVEAGEACAVIESSKAANDLSAPLSGEVTEVNRELLETPGRLGHMTETEAWLFKLRVSERDSEEAERLLSPEDYAKMLKGLS